MQGKWVMALGVAGAVLVLLALGLNLLRMNGVVAPPGVEAPDTESGVAPAVPVAPPDASAPATGGGDTDIPAFDLVRIDREGDSVIAGRAAPGAEVVILDNDVELGRVTADARGEWVFLPKDPLPPGNRELSLLARNPDGSAHASDSVVVLAVPEDDTDVQVAEGAGGTGDEGAAGDKRQDLLAVLVERDGADLESRVLQRPQDDADARSTALITVDTIDYDEAGHVLVAGTGVEGGHARLYLDDVFITGAPVGLHRVWRARPEQQIPPGRYNLRVDMVRDNEVVARIELPFQRVDPRTFAALPEGQQLAGAAGTGAATFVVVQPGNSLWRIARRTLGHGVKFTVIYRNNRNQIRDPDLIYPGQVFVVPQ